KRLSIDKPNYGSAADRGSLLRGRHVLLRARARGVRATERRHHNLPRYDPPPSPLRCRGGTNCRNQNARRVSLAECPRCAWSSSGQIGTVGATSLVTRKL